MANPVSNVMEILGVSLLAGVGGHMAAKSPDGSLRTSFFKRKDGGPIGVALDTRTIVAGASLAACAFGIGGRTMQGVCRTVGMGAGASLLTTEAIRRQAIKDAQAAAQVPGSPPAQVKGYDDEPVFVAAEQEDMIVIDDGGDGSA
tara:strand:+ start:1313 stop:1747 length:435 start_codon:yes stop_codon:yes gene_type:complete